MAGWTNRPQQGRIANDFSWGDVMQDMLGSISKVKVIPVSMNPEFPYERGVVDVDFPLLGAREYSHGSSMLEGMLASLRELVPGLDRGGVIRRFKIVRQFDTLARVVSMERSKARTHPRLKECAARLDLDINGQELTSLLFPRSAPPQGRLPEYDPGHFIAALTPDTNGGHLKGVVDFIDLFRAINECNRQLTLSHFPTPDWSNRVRLAYFEDLDVLSNEMCAAVTRITFSSPEVVELGNHRFEIKRGSLEADDFMKNFSVCFFIELPGRGDDGK